PGWMPQKWTWIPRELPGGRASFIHVFEPVEDGQTRGANVFYSVMEQMKMLDTLQNPASDAVNDLLNTPV
ncbi:phage portal protein, partial [Escherichia coli]|nr:phage portal protein [Escherichia coli]